MWQIMKGSAEEGGEQSDHEDGANAEQRAPERALGRRKHQEHIQLLSDLKDMQKRRHVCEIVFDILADERVKSYSWMSLA